MSTVKFDRETDLPTNKKVGWGLDKPGLRPRVYVNALPAIACKSKKFWDQPVKWSETKI